MKEIPLTKGRMALVDDEDFEVLSRHKWHYAAAGYACWREYSGQKSKVHFMHRYILNAKPGMTIDHINGNSLDNRKSNLRICSQQQNVWNMKKPRHNTSGYKGVSWDKERKRWAAYIKINKKKIYLGRFMSIKAAKEAYNKAAIKLYGEFARINE